MTTKDTMLPMLHIDLHPDLKERTFVSVLLEELVVDDEAVDVNEGTYSTVPVMSLSNVEVSIGVEVYGS